MRIHVIFLKRNKNFSFLKGFFGSKFKLIDFLIFKFGFFNAENISSSSIFILIAHPLLQSQEQLC